MFGAIFEPGDRCGETQSTPRGTSIQNSYREAASGCTEASAEDVVEGIQIPVPGRRAIQDSRGKM